jgi:hypothetical protein
MKEFGKHLNLRKKHNPLEEKDHFCDIIDIYEATVTRSRKLYQEYGMAFPDYDENFLVIIDNLLYLKYGEWKTEIITWYVWERMDEEGNIGDLEYEDTETGFSKTVTVKCSEDLWDILKEIEEH